MPSKKTYLQPKTNGKLFSVKRAVFAAAAVEVPHTEEPVTPFRERYDHDNEWRKFNAKTNFDPQNFRANFDQLAQSVFPKNESLQHLYAQKIGTDLANRLKTGTIDTFWKELQKRGCNGVEIKEGSLIFTKDGNLMDVSDLLSPVVLNAKSSLTETKDTERTAIALRTAGQLAELQEKLPSLPT